MLVELVVENYAVVERLRVRFHPGLNLLTGETGSGKSIVVDALSLLFGGRASAEAVRTGAERARISGIFELPQDAALTELLEQAGIDAEDGELLVEREIQAGGKSRAFAGSRPTTAAMLRELAGYLGDIHGQHDQQQLFSSDYQLRMLDAFAGNGGQLERVDGLFREWRETGGQLAELEASEQEKLRLADLWRFQRNEIETAAPAPGEDTALESERLVLRNVARLEEHTSAAFELLYESEVSALTQIRQAWRHLDEITRFDESLAPIRNSLQSAEATVEEAAHELRRYLGRLEADPKRLDDVEARLAALDMLKRKYGAAIGDILAFLEEVKANLEAMESAGERRAALKQRQEKLAAEFEAAAGQLTQARREAARKLEGALEQELKSLAMERTVFRVLVEAAPWSAGGADRVRFLVSTNPGEDPRPLEKVASGGELSRIALALKTCVAAGARSGGTASAGPRTLVFDEVDAGVGGSAAESVGRRLKRLAAASQVLCVTHLPQIAGFADHHYHVAKSEVDGRTVATLAELSGEDRVREIGRMLSGQKLTAEALRHAEQLVKLAAE